MLSKTEAYPLSTTDKRQNLPIIQPHTEGKAGYHFLILLSEVSNHCSASAIPTVQLMSQQQLCLPSCTVITLPKIFSSVKWNWTLYKIIARSFFNDFFFFKLPLHGKFANYFRQVPNSKKALPQMSCFIPVLRTLFLRQKKIIFTFMVC